MNQKSHGTLKLLIIFAVYLFTIVSCKTSENNTTTNPKKATETDKSPESMPIYRPTPSRTFDLIHTTLNIKPDLASRTISGKTELTMVPYFYPQDFVVLDAKNFEVHSVSLSMNDSGVVEDNLLWENTDAQLIVDLGKYYNAADTIALMIDYTARPYHNLPSDQEATDPARGMYFINAKGQIPARPTQIWTQGETGYNSSWFPTFDQPNERHTQQISITVPDSMVTVANGILVSSLVDSLGNRTDTWYQSQPHPVYLTAFAAGVYSEVNLPSTEIDLRAYIEPRHSDVAISVFAETAEMINYFSNLLNREYPWDNYKQIAVREFVAGGMENTSCSFFTEEIQMTSQQLVDDNYEKLIAHELFHQWFGNLVTCESWNYLTLNEAFASYAEQLWLEFKYGEEEAAFHALNELDEYLQEAEGKQEPLIRDYYGTEEELFDNHTYAKGARVLHALRSYVGDEAFLASMRFYIQQHAQKSVELADLRMAFEEITGEDLNWFFEQWFYKAGHPELAVSHSYEEDTLSIQVTQMQQNGLYRLPLFVDLIYKDRIYQYPLVVEDSIHNFKIVVSETPEAVIFDSEYSLVGVIDHLKSEEELLAQYSFGDNFFNRYEACIRVLTDSSSARWDDLFRLAVKDSSRHIRQLSLELLLSQLTAESLLTYKDIVAERTYDSSPQVRSVALQILYEDRRDIDFWMKFIKDSSLLVQSVALDYLLSEGTKSDSLFNVYKSSPYTDHLIPVSFFINANELPGMTNWYIEKIWSAPSTDRYYLAQSFADYIVSQPIQDKKKAVAFFAMFGKVESYYMNRLSAVQGLLLLEDISGAATVADELIEIESDPRLKSLYEAF